MTAPIRIIELSTLIAKETAKLNNFFVQNALPTPSLEADALWSLPIPEDATDLEASRLAVISACSELKALMKGPKALLYFKWTAYSSVKALLRFKLDKSFPVEGSSSFAAMSEISGLNVDIVRRIVRHAILHHHFFQEKKPGVITHSALTAVLARDDVIRNGLVVQLDEFWPAGVKMADAMEKWPNSEENNETGFSLANNTNKSMFDYFADHPERAARFGMLFSLNEEPLHLLHDGYPWESKMSVVDVGGGHGTIAISLAKRFPHLKCTVQDLPATVAEGASQLPEALRDRVSFMAHDFFTEQPVVADIYFFRSIFHNWADKYCTKILQNLIPALRPDARVLIHEQILPEFESLSTAGAQRATHLDVGMKQLLNAKEREMGEWPELFRKADPRFQYLGARRPEGGTSWIIEATWQG
ncbi:S-adenosyl-L-methionine-dependent methyltransferase [Whalleya microplaca]|nr:S-adenosyl-L-methionine-dependent methyltransferase [Whalleya microplaca]